jgi:chromosome segregation ATPase
LPNIPSGIPAASHTEPKDLLSHVTPLGVQQETPSEPEPTIEHDVSDSDSEYSHNANDNPDMTTTFASKPVPPSLNLGQGHLDSAARASSTFPVLLPSQLNKPLPRSPSSAKFAAFFGWGASSPSATEFSSIPSPTSPKHSLVADDSQASSAFTSTSRSHTQANAATANPLGYCESYLHTPPPPAAVTPSPPAQIEEMEDELKAISAELASSIRREMDLEDLVDRLKAEVNNPQAPGKRTSDYFSDSGISSAKFSEWDQGKEEIETIQRRAEQEKAQIRLELTTKLQDERSKRKGLDQQIKELAQKASQMDTARMNNRDANGRLRDLESTCGDLRRRLSEEQQAKGNFEDLLSALKSELKNAANERDNLRDEVVPQLRARVEGLEAQAAEYSKSTYDATKMQQELRTLKEENTNLRKSKPESDARLSRSNSVTVGAFKLQKPPTGLSRSNTTKQVESREALAERLKDVEAQRDALHSALKSLLERQEFQNRENEKKIKALEVERERLLEASPKKAGFEKDISNLRNEINVLRRRAEEAIDQKWQVEKGLSGLKMDLDRAEEEIASLRSVLKEKDILLPPLTLRSSGNSDILAVPVTSASLEEAYKDLQVAYGEALARVKKLEAGAGTGSDEKTQLALQRLEQSLSTAIS